VSPLTTVLFDPALPDWLLAALAAAAIALAGYGLVRRARGSAWRALVLAVLWLALLDPSASREKRRPLDDVVALAIDRSPSQEIGERAEVTTRAAAALEERLARLPGIELRTVTVEGDGGGEGTRLFTALSRLLADVPPERLAGTIVVTDGQVHDAPDEATAARARAPLHVLLTGRAGERDRRLVLEAAPSYGIVGEAASIVVTVDDDTAGEAVVLALRVDGGRARRKLARVGEPTEISIDIEHAGITAVEIEVEPGEAELTLANNRVVAVLNGVRDRLRVMLVSGEPNPGLRTWRNLLKADPSVDLVHFTILRPPSKQDLTPVRELSLIPFPTNELFAANLAEFDLIIFDSYHRRGILPMVYLSNVVDYVLGGGAVLDSAGPAFASPLSLAGTPIGTILPGRPNGRIYREGFKPRLTAEGFRHPVTAELPGARATGDGPVGEPSWGRWFRHIDVDLDSGVTLMKGFRERPLLVLDRVGEGRVAQLLSDHSWLWARGFEGGGPQSDLLRRLVHWLMKEPDLEEDALVAEAKGGRIEITRRSLAPVRGTVRAITPDGTESELVLADQGDGRATATLAADAVGLYRFEHDRHTAIAVVGTANVRETEDVRSTDAIMRPLAEASGGAVVWLAEAGLPELRRVREGRDASGRGWIGLVERRQHQLTGLEQVPLLPAWLLLGLALGGLMLAWRAEGR
jgi:hypothetical protein